ncbi:hypothetical protein BT69DRAFT_1289889 [Atractiella rhizophila]|nr:hypothetical protein BT69DRAFT_1289889 [Atractiella rhizophila]
MSLWEALEKSWMSWGDSSRNWTSCFEDDNSAPSLRLSANLMALLVRSAYNPLGSSSMGG